MEFFIIAIIIVVLLIVLKIVFEYNMKILKHIADDDELDEIAQKYPNNVELCKEYLKRLNNEKVIIEEDKNGGASLYIAITNKIVIANIQNTYTRIQTIAHECLHSIQNRKLLIFNFVFSNVYLIYFTLISILAVCQKLPNSMIFLNILLILGFTQYLVKAFLENDAMLKARHLAKEYLEEVQITTDKETEKLVNGFDKINALGIKCVNYKLYFDIMIKAFIFCVICAIR